MNISCSKGKRAMFVAAFLAAAAPRPYMAAARADEMPTIPRTTCDVLIPGYSVSGEFLRDEASGTEIHWDYARHEFDLYQADLSGYMTASEGINGRYFISIFHYPYAPAVYMGTNHEPQPPNSPNWKIAVALAKGILAQCPGVN